MRCKHVRGKLDAYQSNELPPQVRGQIDEHLESCEGCRQALRRLRKLKGVLEAAPGAPLPAGFAERVLQKARRRQPAAAARFSLNPFRWWLGSPAGIRFAAAASLGIGLALGGLLGSDMWGAAADVKPPADPVAVYRFDYLSAAPDGSMGQAFSLMIAAPGKAGE